MPGTGDIPLGHTAAPVDTCDMGVINSSSGFINFIAHQSRQ
jgi:hypothetical protein